MPTSASTRWSTPSLAIICLLMGGLGWALGQHQQKNASPHVQANVSRNTPLSPDAASPNSGDSLTAAAIADSTENIRARFDELLAQPSTPGRDRALIALLEQLAKTDHSRALALASAESNWRLRDELRDAALRGWASADATAAGQWALALRIQDRRRAVTAVIQGAAAASPDAAINTALQLCRADPDPAGDYAHSTIAALVQNGAFTEAVRFGQELGSKEFPYILKSAYYEWAQRQPGSALASLESIRDQVTRSAAAAEVYSGWARADASGLAAHALTLPPGEARTQALAEALPHWVEKDPATATAWINENDTGGDFDDGAVAVANLQTLLTRQPAKAMEWAGSIHDPQKREHTLRTVFRQWAEKDPSAARRFVETTSSTHDRNILTSELNDLSPGT